MCVFAVDEQIVEDVGGVFFFVKNLGVGYRLQTRCGGLTRLFCGDFSRHINSCESDRALKACGVGGGTK